MACKDSFIRKAVYTRWCDTAYGDTWKRRNHKAYTGCYLKIRGGCIIDLSNLNADNAQLEAIKHQAGPALVIAGPGSGKTFVITHRILNLIINLGVSPENILVITFTKSAAMMMKDRAIKLCGSKAENIIFSTFHALFYNILIQEGLYTPKSIIKPADELALIDRICKSNEITEDNDDKKSQQILMDINRYKLENIYSKEIDSSNINSIKSNLSDINSKDSSQFDPTSLGNDSFMKIYDEYRRYMENNRLLNFEDMQIEAYKLLYNDLEVREKYQSRFKYILIDEYQDINLIQSMIVDKLVNEEKNLFVVGDDDQCIYGFRGSKPDIMLGFVKKYQEARQIYLDRNYRSDISIVDSSARLIAKNTARCKKNVKANSTDTGVFKIVECQDRNEEFEFIKNFIISKPGEKSEIAIINRTNKGVDFYAQLLTENDIKINIHEKVKDIYENFYIKDILCYLRLFTGDKRRVNFLPVMNRPKRNIDRNSLSEQIDFLEMIKKSKSDGQILELQKLLKDINFCSKLNPYSASHYILNKIGYKNYLNEYAYMNRLDMDIIEETLCEFLERAKEFKSIIGFLNSIEEYKRLLALSYQNNKGFENAEECVNVMTMHASKGLEFKYVILPEVIEGMVPYKRALYPSQLEEERRLFYVAMTRACKELYFLCPRRNLLKETKVSRFIDEIQS